MKYSVTFKCGCTKDVELFGKEADRQRKIDWMMTCTCKDCQNKKAAEESKGMPELTGSEKQVAWATKIRLEMMQKINDFVTENESRIAENQKELFKKSIDYIANQTSASWWIDNRDSKAIVLVSKVAASF